MKELIIIGAGGFALEIIDLVEAINKSSKIYKIIGLLDDNKKTSNYDNYKILGPFSDFDKYQNQYFVLALSNPSLRHKIYNKLKETNKKMINLVHPNTEISNYVNLVEDASIVINYGSQISSHALIEEGVIIDSHSYVGHGTTIKSFTTIYPGTKISGDVIINEFVQIGLGSNIIQGIHIGNNSTIGAGSTVIRNIPRDVVAVGVPCKPIKEKTHE